MQHALVNLRRLEFNGMINKLNASRKLLIGALHGERGAIVVEGLSLIHMSPCNIRTIVNQSDAMARTVMKEIGSINPGVQ